MMTAVLCELKRRLGREVRRSKAVETHALP